MKSFFQNYLERLKNYSNFRLITELLVLAFVTKILFISLGVIVFSLIGINTDPNIEFQKELVNSGVIVAVIDITLFASLETLIGQSFILWLTSRLTRNIFFRVLVSATVFSLLHLDPLLIIAVFPIGIILATVFLIRRERSWKEAFLVTTAIHALHNFLALGLVAAFPVK